LETQVLLTNLSVNLTERANLISEAIKAYPDVWGNSDQAQKFLTGVSVHIEGNIILLKPNGDIIANSDHNSTLGAELIPDSEELRIVLSGEPSVEITYGLFTHNVEVLVPVIDTNQQIQGIVGVTHSLEGIASQFDRLRTWVVMILVIELILGCLIGVFLASRLSKPISSVATAIIDISRGQRIDSLPDQGPEEIRRLSDSVIELSERLRILEETRQRSLANIVHELGRPLGAMLSAVHVLRQSAGDDPEIRQELLEGIETEINHMQPLLDDLAQLHVEVSGNIKLNLESIQLSNWLTSVLLPWRAAALDKGLEWQASIPSNLPPVKIDPEKLARAISNLLSNGIKYTPEGGKVIIEAGFDSKEILITVSDTGPGIKLDEQKSIFEPFYRSEQQKRFPQGLGLGLTIAQDLVEAHTGRLELKSTYGKGSEFIIHLPINLE
jgi:signal transduction histidine kinase